MTLHSSKNQKFWQVLLTIILIPSLVFLSSCAVLTHGSNQMIPVASSPQGAEIFVDGQYVGITPMQVDLSRASVHTITLRLGDLKREIIVTNAIEISSVALDAGPGVVSLGLGTIWIAGAGDPNGSIESNSAQAALALFVALPVFIGSLSAVVVDASTGAWYELSPGEVFVDFEQP